MVERQKLSRWHSQLLHDQARGSKYLLRAWFMYGNYDGFNNQSLRFDLHLGVNFWATVNITDPGGFVTPEAITVASADLLWVCLVNTGYGTPFISSLEARPLKDNRYPAANASRSLVLFKRINLRAGDAYIRYPDDPHDRLWEPGTLLGCTEISSSSTVDNLWQDFFEVPSAVLQTAATPVNSTKIDFSWDPYPGDVNEYYPILHFSELSNLTGTDASRQFNIYVNGYRWLKHPVIPLYLKSDHVYSSEPVERSRRYNITLEALSNSNLPPILNAVEIYSRMNDANVPSDAGDVNAMMMMIKAWYKIMRNWMGDPCSPKGFAWDGINCTFSILNPPMITPLNLSSSGLTGEINKYFASLGAIDYL